MAKVGKRKFGYSVSGASTSRANESATGGRQGEEGGGQFCKPRALKAAGGERPCIIPEEVEISLHHNGASKRVHASTFDDVRYSIHQGLYRPHGAWFSFVSGNESPLFQSVIKAIYIYMPLPS